MASNPRILIVSASVGSGHTQAALAIKHAVKKEYGYQASVIDFLSGGGRYFGKLVKSTYFRALKIFPEIWDYVYRYSNEPKYGEPIKSVLQLASERYMLRIIRRYSPDVLVFTHPFPCAAAAGLKKEGKISIPLVGVVTDYALHRLWEYREVDYYCVATDEMAGNLMAQGFYPDAVYSTGIPVREMFHIRPTVTVKPGHVLIMGGGLGMGPTAQIVKHVADMPEVTGVRAICGKNTELYHMLKSPLSRVPNLRVYGFTQRIPELMAASDLLITKPGGLTISEALCIGLPMLLIDAIGGQEEDNAVFLVSNGVACWAHTIEQMRQYIKEILTDPARLQTMREKCFALARPQAAVSVAAVINKALQSKSVL